MIPARKGRTDPKNDPSAIRPPARDPEDTAETPIDELFELLAACDEPTTRREDDLDVELRHYLDS